MKILPCTLILLFQVTTAFAFSNFSLGDYEDHTCHQPATPVHDNTTELHMFEAETNSYIACMEAYITAAQNDQLLLEAKRRKAQQELVLFQTTLP